MWHELALLSINIFLPWILLGDFNIGLAPVKRVSQVLFDQREINDFVKCCDRLKIYDILTSGFFYTWDNRQEGNIRIWAKFDGVMLH